MAIWVNENGEWVEIAAPHVQTSSSVRMASRVTRQRNGTTVDTVWQRADAGYSPATIEVEPIDMTRNGFAVTVRLPEAEVLPIRRVVVKVRPVSPATSPEGNADYFRRTTPYPSGTNISPGRLADENDWSDFFQGEQHRDGKYISGGRVQTKYTDRAYYAQGNYPEIGVYGDIPLGKQIWFAVWVQYSDGTWSDPSTTQYTTRTSTQDPFGLKTFQTVVEPIATDRYQASTDSWIGDNISYGGPTRLYGAIFFGERLRQVFKEASKSGVVDLNRRVTRMRLRLVRWSETGFGVRHTKISIGISRDGTRSEAINGPRTSIRILKQGPEVWQRWSYNKYWEYGAPDLGRPIDIDLPSDMRKHFFEMSGPKGPNRGGLAKTIILGNGYLNRPADTTERWNSSAYFRAHPVKKGDYTSSGYVTVTWRGYTNPWRNSTPGAINFQPMRGEGSNGGGLPNSITPILPDHTTV